jgi:hypothetical protein
MMLIYLVKKINTINKIQKNPLYDNKEVFLEATAEKTKYMLMARQHTKISQKIIRKCGTVQFFWKCN